MHPRAHTGFATTRTGLGSSARGLAVCLSFALAACSTTTERSPDTAQSEQTLPRLQERVAQEVEAPRPNVTVAAVGDIMLGTDYPEPRLPPQPRSLLEPVTHVLRAADVTIGNLEGVLQDGGAPVKQCANPARCYLFRSPASYAAELAHAGFDVMSLANNHARDFGEEGRSSSMAQLAAVGIAHTGRQGDVATLQVNESRVAVIAYAPFIGSHNMLALETARERIAALARQYDIVIVSFHGGGEGGEMTRIPFATEYYHGENRGDVVAFARMAVDAGADLVLGHGPHVPRALELYRERLIAYSLGNFATYWGIKVSGTNGLAPILTAELEADGRFVQGEIFSARQQRPVGPQPDSTHAAAKLMAELTRSDFPETPLVIDKRGSIRVASPSAISGAPPAAGGTAKSEPLSIRTGAR
ncbi:MAG: CapA family protein [Pseudomonadota bacterium]